VAGDVTGVRFYKSSLNTGKHTGSLWSTSGRLLATTTFTGETKSGWQTAQFSKPVSIAANVTYIISYHAPKGHYAVNGGYFKTSAHTTQKLTAPMATATSDNGMYKYTATQASYPNTNAGGSNYWVDVVFTSKLVSAPVAPAAPANLVANLQGTTSVALAWQASASASPVSTYQVYRGSTLIGSTASTHYTDTGLTAGSSYDYTIKAVDITGAASVPSLKATIAIPKPGTSTTGTGGSSNGSTTPPAATTNLFSASKKELAMQLVSSAENSSLNWKAQYAYIEDIGDGRGYTGGIIGFCSGTDDMLSMVQYYAKLAPGNVLAKYIPALQKVNGTASHTGLGTAFVADWKTAAKDAKFQQAQDYERDQAYFNPAVNQAVADGLHPLGQFIYYDAMVMHGPGSDPVSFGGIRATAMKKAKTPAQGGNETTYLNAYLDARKAAMLTEAAHDNTDRVDTEQRVFLKAGNLNLDAPLKWTVYGDAYSIAKNP
jgi:chitosanase